MRLNILVLYCIKLKRRMMNKLSRFTEEHENGTILIQDSHNLVFRTLFSANASLRDGSIEENNFSYFKYIYLKTLFASLKDFKPKNLVFAMDDKLYWRKGIYSDYKANRKVMRLKSDIDFEKFFPMLDEFMDNLKIVFPNFQFVKVDRCEADDIIGVMTANMNDKIIVITTDRDMNQTTRRPNVEQWDPIKRKYVKSINIEKDLLLKIIKGDKGDNIPAIEKRVGDATAIKILERGLDNLSESARQNFARNELLIDLRKIPLDIQNSIVKTINDIDVSGFNGQALYSFLVKERLVGLTEELQQYSGIIKKINENIRIEILPQRTLLAN